MGTSRDTDPLGERKYYPMSHGEALGQTHTLNRHCFVSIKQNNIGKAILKILKFA